MTDEKATVHINLTAVDNNGDEIQMMGDENNLKSDPGPTNPHHDRPTTALSRISKLFSDSGSVSSYESDSSDEELGFKPLKSMFLGHQSRPGTALASKERPNLNATTEATKGRIKVMHTLKKDLKEIDVLWIKDRFLRKDCICYIEEGGVCACGRDKEAHDQLSQSQNSSRKSLKWMDMQHCSILPTDALGLVKLGRGTYNTARYIRMSDDTEHDDMLQLLRDFWHLKTPGIVLSFIGAGNTKIPHKLYQTIQRDIAKVGKLTNAWVFTDGASRGSASVIGHMLSTHGYPIPAIAFSHWGGLDNPGCLQSPEEDPTEVVNYVARGDLREVRLDNNHTHLVLVDDGTVKDSGCDDKYRHGFEQYLNSQFNIPLLFAVIGGVEEDGGRISEILAGGSSVVMVKGSGGFADDYCDFHKHLEDQLDLPLPCSCLKDNKPCQAIIDKMDHDFDFSILKAVFNHRQHISVYDYTQVSDFDTFVLKLLVTSIKGYTVDRQLDLACKWSRVDVAEFILSEQLDATTGAKHSSGLTKTLFHALVWGHTDFSGVLVENGADIYDIQANLVSLYDSAYFSPRCNHVIQLLEKYTTFEGNRKIRRRQVDELLNMLISNGFTACTGYEVDPFFELTLWAVLMLREDMAVLLWRYTQDPIRCALVVILLLYRMKHHVYLEKDDDRRRVSSMYDIFEDLAVAVMNQAWLSDSEICRRAMISRWQRIRGYNYLDLAFHGHARNFMAHPACQEIISAGWRGWFRRDTGALRVWLIIFLPFLCVTPLVPFDKRVNYRRAVQGRYRMIYIDKLSGVEAMYKRAVAFYAAPVTKFWMSILFYLVFLVFHSYNLFVHIIYLDKDNWDKLAWTEVVVWVWLGMWVLGELQEAAQSKKGLGYFADSWNRIDMGILMVYAIGIILRVIPDVTCFHAGRTIIAVNSIPMFIRMLMLFEYKPALGPFLLMVREMMKDMAVFLLLLLIFLTGFGVSYVAILIPPNRFSWQSMAALFMYPYFQMFGDFYLDVFELENPSGYIEKTYSPDHPDSMVTKGQGIVSVVLLVVWVLISTVVLVNLLIAMFSDTYRTIKDNQVVIWKYQRYKMLLNYRGSMVPPPFNILHYILSLLSKCCKRACLKRDVKPEKDPSPGYWKDCMIRTFMQDARDEYLTVTQSSSGESESVVLRKLQAVEQHLKIMRRVGNKASSVYA